MKIQILQENLNSALQFLAKISTQKGPLLTGGGTITITAKDNLIKATAEDIELTATKTILGKTVAEGTMALPTATLQPVIALFSKETITICREKGGVLVKGERSEAVLREEERKGLDKKEEEVKKQGSLSKKTAAAVVERVKGSASADQARATLTGVFVHERKDETIFVATDGFRLSRLVTEGRPFSLGEKTLVLPARLFTLLLENMENDEQAVVSESAKTKQYYFETKTTRLTSRLIEGQYPDYEKILPKNPTTTTTVDREPLLSAVRLASVFAKDNANIVRLEFGEKALTVSADSPKAGKSKSVVDAVGKGENITAAFNYRFLIDFLLSLSEVEKIKIETAGPLQPASFTAEKDTSYLHVIMPVRVQG